MKLLITGGAGFIGSNFVRFLLDADPDVTITNLDLLTYAGNLESLGDVFDNPRHQFVRGDIRDGETLENLMKGVDAVVNLAAETHVDRSLASAARFVETNVLGTERLLSAAMEAGVSRFLQVSTDEVYGQLPWRDPDGMDGVGPRFTEDSPLDPRSPYSASKAAADLLVLSYFTSFGLDVVVTRCSNNYGPYQFPEKLIPLVVTNALLGLDVPVYGDGLYVRDWLHVMDHCRGLLMALRDGLPGRVYNFGGNAESTNLQIVRTLLSKVGASEGLIRFVRDRKGHDRRYAVDVTRAGNELGWEPRIDLASGLASTVAWYRSHEPWWARVRSGDYATYYETMYGKKGRHGL